MYFYDISIILLTQCYCPLHVILFQYGPFDLSACCTALPWDFPLPGLIWGFLHLIPCLFLSYFIPNNAYVEANLLILIFLDGTLVCSHADSFIWIQLEFWVDNILPLTTVKAISLVFDHLMRSLVVVWFLFFVGEHFFSLLWRFHNYLILRDLKFYDLYLGRSFFILLST